MDTLPHNGAVITLLAVTGLTHRQSYRDIFAVTVIKTLAVFLRDRGLLHDRDRFEALGMGVRAKRQAGGLPFLLDGGGLAGLSGIPASRFVEGYDFNQIDSQSTAISAPHDGSRINNARWPVTKSRAY